MSHRKQQGWSSRGHLKTHVCLLACLLFVLFFFHLAIILAGHRRRNPAPRGERFSRRRGRRRAYRRPVNEHRARGPRRTGRSESGLSIHDETRRLRNLDGPWIRARRSRVPVGHDLPRQLRRKKPGLFLDRAVVSSTAREAVWNASSSADDDDDGAAGGAVRTLRPETRIEMTES